MKRLIIASMAAIIAALAFCSCEEIGPDSEYSGTPYGFWVVDSLQVKASITINGNTHNSFNTTDFTRDYCRLVVDKNLQVASVWYNLDAGTEDFSYDEAAKRFTVKGEDLHAGNNGKAIVLFGIYDVELSGNRMILRQESSLLGVSESNTYFFHRAPKSEKPKEIEP